MQYKVMTPAVAIAATITSGGVDLGDMIAYSFQATFSGSDAAGIFHLEASNQPATNFVDISGLTVTVSSAGAAMISTAVAGYRYVRYSWVRSGGTGNITVTFCGKEKLGATRNRTGK